VSIDDADSGDETSFGHSALKHFIGETAIHARSVDLRKQRRVVRLLE
jgi:hypothetical protein